MPVAVTGIEIVLFGLLLSVTVTVAGPANEVEPIVRTTLNGEENVPDGTLILESLDAAV